MRKRIMGRGLRAGRGFQVLAAEADGQRPTLWIYEQIGKDWWSDEGVSAREVIEALMAVGAADIDVRLNSPGGIVDEGVAIHNALARHPGKVFVKIDAAAYSIASLIAMAGHEIEIAENARMMVHSPWTIALGNAKELRRQADTLDTFEAALLTTYARRTGLGEEELKALLEEETWMTAAQAVEHGFADKVADFAAPEDAVAARSRFDLSRYRNAPEDLRSPPPAPDPAPEPEAEGLPVESARARLRLLELGA